MGDVIAFPAREYNPEIQLPLAAGAESFRFYSVPDLYEPKYTDVLEFARHDLLTVPQDSKPQYEAVLTPTWEAVRVSDLEIDKATRLRHQKWLGSIALGDVVAREADSNEQEVTLAEAIHKVRGGDATFLPLIEMNIQTATGESFEKAAYVRDVVLEEGPDGEIVQFGQSMKQVHENTLRYCDWQSPDMYQRTKVESLAAFRSEDSIRTGLADTHWLIDISLIPELPDDELDDMGFFSQTKTGIIRGFTRNDEGELIWRSAFFAGAVEEGAERHDVEAVKTILVEDFGIAEAAEWDVNQILGCVLAVSKDQLPNGPVDIMSRLDDSIMSITGEEVYWGQAGTRGDYESVIEESKARDSKRDALNKSILEDLIASHEPYNSPLEATDALKKLLENHGTVEIINDESYPSWLLGKKAQADIELARVYRYEIQALEVAGQVVQAQKLMHDLQMTTQRAQSHAKSGGCPTARAKATSDSDLGLDCSLPLADNEESMSNQDEDEYGPLEFECTEGCRNTRKRGELIDECKNAKYGCKGKVAC